MILFQVSIALLIFVPVYTQFFLVETVESAPRKDQESSGLKKAVNVLDRRYKSMRDAALMVVSRYSYIFVIIFISINLHIFLHINY